jgi:Uma2 family endonuclease
MTAAAALNIEGDRLRIPSWAWDHTGFRRWIASPDFPDTVRASFIGGEVFIEMSPEKLESHNKVKTAVTATLDRIVREDDLGEVFSDGVLLSHPTAGVSTEPDGLFVSWASFESAAVRLVPSARGDDFVEIEGAPDMVLEIVSDSSQRKDLHELRRAYAAAGVREYWIFDARGSVPSFQILTLSGSGYEVRSPSGPQHSSVFQGLFSLMREPNRAGRWRYRFEAQKSER